VSNPAIALQSVTKRFGAITAVDNISLTIAPGEFFSLLGPSGCGKTTLLRLVGGFESPDAGEIILEGRPMAGIPPQHRPVNTVFQNYALFPHLNVFDNVAFGLRMKRLAATEIKRRTAAALALTQIDDLRGRFPAQLSGGQKQRVALARAIVNEPAVLLLDEPLAAIDAKLRAQLQTDLRNLQRELQTTFLYVTHDQDEALALSDRVAVLHAGRVGQCGTPAEIYEQPRNRFVASFLGGCNIITGRMTSKQQVETPIGPLRVSTPFSAEKVCLGIRRERFGFAKSIADVPNRIRGRIVDRAYTGAKTEYAVEVNGTRLHVSETRAGNIREIGETVTLTCLPEAILVLEDA
jgi:spermidine/putrescine transport system ATP-binding protein